MEERIGKYKKQSHATYDCKYHCVFVTKYRFKIIDKDIERSLKWRIKEVCDWKGIEILKGYVGEEHVHLYLQIPPKYSISDVMKWIKGKSGTELFRQYPLLKKKYWGGHMWARGYFVTTVGISDEIIKRYIENQRREEQQSFDQLWDKGKATK